MPKNVNEKDMSELEKDFELEMEEEPVEKEEPIEERELEEEFERVAELKEERPEEEFEEIEEREEPADYAERFYELSLREFESEAEVDDAVNKLLNEMEREYFFKGLWKKLKKGGKWLLKKGIKLAKGLPVFQAVKGITQLARGNLKGLLGSLAKAGLGAAVSAIPGGAAILPALKAIGFEVAEEPEQNQEAWRNYDLLCREAFDHLASNINEKADDPIEASRLATEAFQSALKKVSTQKPYIVEKGKRYRVQVRKGDVVIIEGI